MIPSININKNKLEDCYFLHANGFPPDAYSTFLNLLSENYNINSMLLRPLWKDKGKLEEVTSWNIFLEDFLSYCKENDAKQSIGIGHSIGGNLLIRAAIQNKNLFKSIILLDPTILHPLIILIWKILSSLNIFKSLIPHASAARNRREKYDTYEDILLSYKKKNIFQKITDQQLEEYINSIFKYKNGRYKLVYDKYWEEVIYLKASLKDFDIWNNLDTLAIPTLIIKPDKNSVLGNRATKKLLKNKFISIKTMKNSTHLFPLEYPKETSKLISDFLSKDNNNIKSI